MERMRRALTSAIYISSLLAAVLLWPIPLLATNYTVKAGGGGNYSTIQACANAMAAGDTCTVFTGTYNESVTVSAGGVGAYKTLTVNPGDTVFVLSFTINSHVKVNGFHIQNTSSPNTTCVSVASSSTDFYITNNTMTSCGSVHMNQVTPHNTHGFIQGNTISYMGNLPGQNNNGPAFYIECDYCLFENNDVSHVSDWDNSFTGSYNVFRYNTMHDTPASECTTGGNGGNCHIDFVESEPVVGPGFPTKYNLIEHNTQLRNIGGNAHNYLMQADVCNGQCTTTIIRFNIGVHGGAGVENDNQWLNLKAYNNTWVDVGSGSGGGITNSFLKSATNGTGVNDIFYFPGSVSDWNAIATDGSTSPTFAGSHNLAFCVGSPCTIHGYPYGSGNWTDDPTNKLADPLFVNYAANDFHLQSGSPARGAGTNLTTANGSGSSSTTLVIADANFFQDNAGGIPGVQADWIRIGASTTVQISSINYSTNTITLASPVSWSNGNPIYLYKDSSGNVVLNGANPDMGVMFDSGSASGPAPPTGLAALVN